MGESKNKQAMLDELKYFNPAQEAQKIKLDDSKVSSVMFPTRTSYTVTNFTRGLFVNGDVSSDDSLSIAGRVNGNVSTEGDMAVSGLINGDVKARNLNVTTNGVKGNVDVQNNMTVEKNAVVVGDIRTNALIVDGKIKGDIKIEESTVLQKSCLVAGSITTGSLSVEDGARVSADVRIVNPQINGTSYNEEEFTIGD